MLDEAQARIKIAGQISITADMQMIPPLWQKQRRTKDPEEELKKVKKESEKAGLKLNSEN